MFVSKESNHCLVTNYVIFGVLVQNITKLKIVYNLASKCKD